MKIPLFQMQGHLEEIRASSDVIRRESSWANGPEIINFENNLSKYTKIKYCTVFNSGTSALHSLLLAYDIKQGDEVIVPSFTFISTPNNVKMVGATPIFCDIEIETMGLKAETVESLITHKTKAVIIVHYSGMPARDIVKIQKICLKHKILLFEDCAESIGARYKNKMVGTFGDAGMFSFCQNKIITSGGEGGAIITKNKDIYDKLLLIRSHGRLIENDNEKYVMLGYNFRMPSICAAIGLSQLNRINLIIKKRRRIASHYNVAFSKIKQIRLLTNKSYSFSVYQLYTIILDSKENKESLKKYLISKNIGCKTYFNPVHLEPTYNLNSSLLALTVKISNSCLSIPIFPDMDSVEQTYVINAIKLWAENL